MKIQSLLLALAITCIATTTNAQCWNINDSTYTMGFETTDMAKFANWTVVDSDANDTTWSIANINGDSSAVVKTYGNDWLFTSCMQLTAGTAYEISFWYKRAYPYFNDQGILLTTGSAATVNAITDTLFNKDSIKLAGYQRAYMLYTPTTTGTQVFGFYAYGTSDFDYTRMYVDNFKINKYVCDTIKIALGNDTTFKFCPNDSLLLGVNTGFETYLWSNNASSTNELWVKEPGTYALQVTHSNGCIGKDSIVVLNDTFYIALGKDSTFSFCKYDSLKLSVETGLAEYHWNTNTSTTHELWVKEAGTYSVQVTHTDWCIAKDTIVVGIDSLTRQDITVSNYQLNKCAEDSISLEAIDSCISYTWLNTSNTQIGSSNEVWVMDAGKYFIIVADNKGCYAKDSIIVTNRTNSISIATNKNTFCSYDSLKLIATNGFTSYNWNGNDSLAQTRQLYVKSSDTYIVIATDNYNCMWCDTIVISDTAIFQAPHDTIIYTKSTICLNDSSLIQAKVVNDLNSKYSFQWIGSVDSVYADTAIYAKTSGTYSVIITDTTTGCRNNHSSVSVAVIEPYSNQDICILTVDSVTKKNSIVWVKQDSLGIDAFKLYRENTQGDFETIATVDYNNTSIFTDTSANPQVRSYSYKITSIDTCGNESNMQYANSHSTIHLAINVGVGGKNNLQWTPYLGFNYNTYKLYRDTSVNQDSPVLIDSVPASINSYTDINPIAGVDNFYYIEVQRDSACVINAKKKGNCINSSRSNVISSVVASVNDIIQNENNISVYPNPFTEQVKITYTVTKTSNTIITLFDILGNKIMEEQLSQQAGSYTYILNKHLPQGIYIIELNINGEKLKKEIIKI